MKSGNIIFNGRYRIEKKLGAGAFGEVYSGNFFNSLIAIEFTTKNRVAIKVVRKNVFIIGKANPKTKSK